jgi:FAD-linked sulfhydryl oxidase
MGHGCEESICIDKPSITKLSNIGNSFLFKQTEEDVLYPQRPLYRTEFGNSTWKVLHRISINYPSDPNEYEKNLMEKMIKGLSIHFPCPECAEHFRKEISIFPPKVDNKNDVIKWFCYQHNQVNKRLGKEIVICDNIDKIINDFKI